MLNASSNRAPDVVGRALLAAAVLVACLLALIDVAEPWEDGLRGDSPAVYETYFVHSYVHYGLAFTKGVTAYINEVDGRIVPTWYWHHPATYPLYLAAVASVFGESPLVLRLAHLVLYLPGIAALWWLLARVVGERFAGFGALAFALSPLISYFGPMVVHDGAVMTCGLAAVAAFVVACERPSRWASIGAAGFYFLATLFDYAGHLWGVALFVIAWIVDDRRRGFRLVALMAALSLASLFLIASHFGMVLGSPLEYVRVLLRETAPAHTYAPTAAEVIAATRVFLVDYGAWTSWALGALGAIVLWQTPELPRRRIAVLGLGLMLPGVLWSLVSLRHYVVHAFWSMSSIAGVATFAAVVPVVAVSRLRRAGRELWLARFGLALTVAALAHGVATTLELIDRFRPRLGDFLTLVDEVAPHVNGCAIAVTNRVVPLRPYLPGLSFLGGVDTPAALDVAIEYGRSQGVAADVAFVLDRRVAMPELVARLDQLAMPTMTPHTAIYRFRP